MRIAAINSQANWPTSSTGYQGARRGTVRDITKSREVTMTDLFDRHEAPARHTNTTRRTRDTPHALSSPGQLHAVQPHAGDSLAFRDECQAEGRSAATVRNNLHRSRQCTRRRSATEATTRPVRRVSDNARERRLESGEVARLLEAAAQHRNPLCGR